METKAAAITKVADSLFGVFTGVTVSMLLLSSTALGQTTYQPLAAVPIQQVTIQDAFWSPKRLVWQQVTIPDCLTKFESDGAFSNFDRVRDGLSGGHAGQPFHDGLVYEMIRGSSDFLLASPNPALESRLDGFIARIAAAAAKDTNGFINTYTQLAEPTHRWGLNGGNDVFQHDLYNAGALVEAGVHYYRATGKIKLLQVATKLANHMADIMGPSPKANIVPGHALGEEALVKLYQLFREQPQLKSRMLVPVEEQRYLALSQFWIDNRGNHTGRADYGAYDQDEVPVSQQESLDGHAVRASLFCAGLVAAGDAAGRQDSLKDAQRLWNSLALRRTYITGGVGSQSADEKIGDDYVLPNFSGYLETCAAVAGSFFHHNMNLALGDAGYADELERNLYNGALVCVSFAGNSYFYDNPLESYNGRGRWNWNNTPCCPPMFLKLMGAMPGYIYAQDASGLYVNLFVGSQANVSLNGHNILIAQTTRYPLDGEVKVTIQPDQVTPFAVNLRLPAWCEQPVLKLNGQTIANYPRVRGYAYLQRTWSPGDVLTLSLPMSVQRTRANPRVQFAKGRVALQRGPFIYCLESVDNNGHVANLAIPPNGPLQSEEHPELLGGVVIIKGTATNGLTNTTFTAIPYYSQANRQTGELLVWMPESALSLPGVASLGPLAARNGDFEDPLMGSNSVATVLLTSWFSSANNPWPLGWWRVAGGSQAAEFPPNSWQYQCLGVFETRYGTNLNWSFVQKIPTDANASGAFEIDFYAQNGVFSPGQGIDIASSSGCKSLGRVFKL